MTEHLFIGLISGTSMDALDCALVDLSSKRPRLIDYHSPPIPAELQTRILALCGEGENQVAALGELDVELALLFAEAVNCLLMKNGLRAADISAIGSHGQTIRHRPRHSPSDAALPFTLQICDPNTLCERTGITVVADFRRKDMAAGGQGAPLVPAFHLEAFHSSDIDRVVLNIGGIANISVLPADRSWKPGFDTGPGNVLMDWWIGESQGRRFDEAGRWAASGRPDEALLARLQDDPYFRLPPPKSTGRELFNATWLRARLSAHGSVVAPADLQATLLELSCRSIADAIRGQLSKGEIIVCGGGAHNSQLLARLAALLPGFRVASSEAFGIAPDCVEAMAFAWLASKTLAREVLDIGYITGARHPNILGGVWYCR